MSVVAAPASPTPVLLEVQDLYTHILTDHGRVRAVDGVSLNVRRGQTLGLVGESGSGKSVLGRTIIDILPRDGSVEVGGEVRLEGRNLRGIDVKAMREIRGREVAMVFQDPTTALNPVKRVGEQVAEVIRRHLGASRRAASDDAIDLLNTVGLPSPRERARNYPHELSGGMRQRVAIAIAIAAEPKLLIADEPTTALDVTIQAQILELLARLGEERGMGLILVSHDLGVVSGYADHIAVMYAGHLVEVGPTAAILEAARMQYTRALMSSAPRLDAPPLTRLEAIPGRPPRMDHPPQGCRFHPRCTAADARCRTEIPTLEPTERGDDGHSFACWHPVQTDAGFTS